MSSIPGVVLAGGKVAPEIAVEIQTPVRAMALFQGRSLLEIIVQALCQADPAAPISVVGNVPEDGAYSRVPDQGDFVANLFAGIAPFAAAEWILVTSSDMPFIDGRVIVEFVREALALAATSQADLVYPIVPVAACYARYPGIKRTAIKVREGEFTGGNLMLVRPPFLMRNREVIGRTYAARKNPINLAAMLGPEVVLRLVISQALIPAALRIARLERKVGSLVGGRVAALVCENPEIATDLDRAADFEQAARFARGKDPSPL